MDQEDWCCLITDLGFIKMHKSMSIVVSSTGHVVTEQTSLEIWRWRMSHCQSVEYNLSLMERSLTHTESVNPHSVQVQARGLRNDLSSASLTCFT